MQKYNRPQNIKKVHHAARPSKFAATNVRTDVPPPVTSEPAMSIIHRMPKVKQVELAKRAERRRVLAKAYMEWLRENTELVDKAVAPLAYAIADNHKYTGYEAVCDSLGRSPVSERMYCRLKIALHKTEVHAFIKEV